MKDIDELLVKNLAPCEEPDGRINRQITMLAEKTGYPRYIRKRKRFMLATAGILLFAGFLTACAAWKYLKPAQLAAMTENPAIIEAFNSKDAILINETQSYGGYDVTLLGMASGEVLSDYAEIIDGEFVKEKADRTFYVLAVAHTDGTPMEIRNELPWGEQIEHIYASPAVEGYEPWLYSIGTFGSCKTSGILDGVMYIITECANVEVFADKEIYLYVNEGSRYEGDAYYFDKDTGKLMRNPDYEGLNALFTLPIDAEKADMKAAEQLILECNKVIEQNKEISERYLKYLQETELKNDAQTDK